MSDLRQRLNELARREDSRQPLTPQQQGLALEEVVAGSWHDAPTGRCFVTERRFGNAYVHGGRCIGDLANTPAEVWRPFLDTPDKGSFDPTTALFIDAETTGLGGGGGTYAFLVGIGFFQDGGFVVRQLFMPDYEDEPALLDLLGEAVEACGGLVSFNGRAFDWPLLTSRFVMARRSVRGDGLPHLDLLLLCRRLWRETLSSCSLSSLEQHVLGLERSFEDIAGHLIPDIYRQYVQDGDAGPLDGVFYHNLVDVLSLVSLAQVAAEIASNGLEMLDEPLCDAFALGRLYEGVGRPDKATLAYHRAWRTLTQDARAWEAGWRESLLLKRQGRLEGAVELWQALVNGPSLVPYIELAKYYEHQQRDPSEARRWVLEGQAWLSAQGDEMEPWRRQRLAEQLEHRLGRLEKRRARWAKRGDIEDADG